MSGEDRRNVEGLRLYRAEVAVVYYVAERSQEDAEATAQFHFSDAVADMFLPHVCVTRAVKAEADWMDSIPYSDEGVNEAELTCGDILADPAPATERELEAAGQINLLGGAA